MRFYIGILVVFLALVVYVYFSLSYQLGREAQREFNRGNYQSAYEFATQALEEDPYNRSAFGIANQAKQRLNIQNFLNNAKESQQEAFRILKDGSLTPEEYLRLVWMVEEFSRKMRALLILNQPNAQEDKELKQYEMWFLELKTRLDSVKK